MENLFSALRAAASDYAAHRLIELSDTKKPWMSRPLPWNIIGPVVQEINLHSDLVELTKLRQLPLNKGDGHPLYVTLLASALVKRSYILGDPQKSLNELLDLIRTNTGRAKIVMVLAGVQVEEPVELAPGVHLVPLDKVEPPSWFDDLSEERLWPLSRHFVSIRPSSALVTQLHFSPVFTSEVGLESTFPEAEIDRLKMVAHCIALVAECPTAILKVWYEDDDPRFPLISSGVTFADPGWGNTVAEQHTIDAERVRRLVGLYDQFHGDRAPISTGLTRLARARGGWHREDRVIDLGIALEAILLFVPRARSKDNNEISYKLGIRAAWLLGRDCEHRIQVFHAVRQLYRLRSEAAHQGHVQTKHDRWRAVDAEIDAGIALVGGIVAAVLATGDWPDWDKLVLAGTPV